MMDIRVLPVRGLPLFREGDNIAEEIARAVRLEDGDIVAIASTIYSKAKGHIRRLDETPITPRARSIAEKTGEDPAFIQVVLDESEDILLEAPFVLSRLPSGHVGVRAGVDHSNIEDGYVILLPPDPMGAADEIREELKGYAGVDLAVILTDTCGRPFRRGQTGVAIGWSGIHAIADWRGDQDLFGHRLEITEEAVVDEIAGFANFVMGESDRGVPAVVFRNCSRWEGHDSLYFSPGEDIFRALLMKEYSG
ncbi:MAG: coenzyme F420-0:L-glutamate ligase [Methanoculleaceae archaeon]